MNASSRFLPVLVLILLASFNSYSVNRSNRNPHFVIYPLTPKGVISDDCTLTVNGISVPVEKIMKFSDNPVQYALLDFDGGVKLNFEVKTRNTIKSNSISPVRESIAGKVIGNSLKFSIKKAQYLIVKIPGMADLFILIDPLNANVPVPGTKNVKNINDFKGIDPAGKKDCAEAINSAIKIASLDATHPCLYFPTGTYLSGEIRMKNNVKIYLAGGAVIQATDNKADYPNNAIIYWDHITKSELTGRGIIDGNGRILGSTSGIHILAAAFSKQCLVDGLTERDSPFWANHILKSMNFNYKNIKVINYRLKGKANNTDGLNFDCSNHCSMHNGFFYTGDDNCVVKGTGIGSEYNVHHILFDKYIGYSNSAACKIGTETTIDTIDNISFKNVDIIRCDRALVIDAYDNSKIANINFSNIYVESIAPNGEGSDSSRLIDFLITNSGWRKSAGETSINNVSLENITALVNLSSFPSEIKGISNLYSINTLAFKKSTILNGTVKYKIHSIAKGFISTNQFVYNLVFKD